MAVAVADTTELHHASASGASIFLPSPSCIPQLPPGETVNGSVERHHNLAASSTFLLHFFTSSLNCMLFICFSTCPDSTYRTDRTRTVRLSTLYIALQRPPLPGLRLVLSRRSRCGHALSCSLLVPAVAVAPVRVPELAHGEDRALELVWVSTAPCTVPTSGGNDMDLRLKAHRTRQRRAVIVHILCTEPSYKSSSATVCSPRSRLPSRP